METKPDSNVVKVVFPKNDVQKFSDELDALIEKYSETLSLAETLGVIEFAKITMLTFGEDDG